MAIEFEIGQIVTCYSSGWWKITESHLDSKVSLGRTGPLTVYKIVKVMRSGGTLINSKEEMRVYGRNISLVTEETIKELRDKSNKKWDNLESLINPVKAEQSEAVKEIDESEIFLKSLGPPKSLL